MNDAEIIAALSQNNYARAMKPLYKYRAAVLKMVKQFGGTKEDGEDVFQEALLVLCRKINTGNFNLTSTLNTFLYGVSKNLWTDELRKRNKLITTEIEEELSVEDQQFTQSESRYRQAEQAFLLLGEKCRELLMQFYFYKKTMVEIASMIGFANERVAKNQKYRCMEKAKENFNQLTVDS